MANEIIYWGTHPICEHAHSDNEVSCEDAKDPEVFFRHCAEDPSRCCVSDLYLINHVLEQGAYS